MRGRDSDRANHEPAEGRPQLQDAVAEKEIKEARERLANASK
ncbi:MAG: hypothetical protein ACLVEF_08300 [Bifidobacterium bifidum]